jgi:hypothetical protein
MKLTLSILLLFLSAVTVCQAKGKNCTPPKPVKDAKFRPGQVWKYKTRPGEDNSFLTVLKIEGLPKVGTIVHVRVDNIRLRNCTGGPEPDNFQHMPFTRDAIERSVTTLQNEDAVVPDFQAGYDEWRAACGGVYTISVAEAVRVGEITFTSNLGCGPPGSSK